jgi:hypothetical protein
LVRGETPEGGLKEKIEKLAAAINLPGPKRRGYIGVVWHSSQCMWCSSDISSEKTKKTKQLRRTFKSGQEKKLEFRSRESSMRCGHREIKAWGMESKFDPPGKHFRSTIGNSD